MGKRTCGTCSACCRWPEVKEISKPQGVPCKFLTSKGYKCSIYSTRPEMCAAYNCAWIEGHGNKNDQPDTSGVLVDWRNTEYGQTLVAKSCKPGGTSSKIGRRAIRNISRDAKVICLVTADDDIKHIVKAIGDDMSIAIFRMDNPRFNIDEDGNTGWIK